MHTLLLLLTRMSLHMAERRRDDRGEARTERREPREERREPREERRDDRRAHRRDRDLGPAVIGMGDHVPDFILRSFARVAALETAEDQAE